MPVETIEDRKWEKLEMWKTETTSALATLNTTVVQQGEQAIAAKDTTLAMCRKVDQLRVELQDYIRETGRQRSVDRKEDQELSKELFTTVRANEKAIIRLETAFKIKSSVWGLLGGLIPAMAFLILYITALA